MKALILALAALLWWGAYRMLPTEAADSWLALAFLAVLAVLTADWLSRVALIFLLCWHLARGSNPFTIRD